MLEAAGPGNQTNASVSAHSCASGSRGNFGCVLGLSTVCNGSHTGSPTQLGSLQSVLLTACMQYTVIWLNSVLLWWSRHLASMSAWIQSKEGMHAALSLFLEVSATEHVNRFRLRLHIGQKHQQVLAATPQAAAQGATLPTAATVPDDDQADATEAMLLAVDVERHAAIMI